MPKVTIDGTQLFYELAGKGKPLVLIPGFAAGRWLWFRQTPALAEQFLVITFDPRGISESIGAASARSIPQFATDVAELLKALQVDKANVVGASFGGFVAQDLACRYPELIDSLVLCCTSFGGPNHVAPGDTSLCAFASTKGLNTEERVRQNLLPAFSPQFIEEEPAIVEEVVRLRAAQRVDEESYLGQLQAAYDFDLESRVSEIRARALVISGDADAIVPVENSRRLAEALPNAELQIIEGGSHLFFIEQPVNFNRRISEFVAKAG